MRYQTRSLISIFLVLPCLALAKLDRAPQRTETQWELDTGYFFCLFDLETGEELFAREGTFSVTTVGMLAFRELPISPPVAIPSDATGIAISPDGRVFYSAQGQLVSPGTINLAHIDEDQLHEVAPGIFATRSVTEIETGIPSTRGFPSVHGMSSR